jgi:hypothetical protein
MIHPPYKPYALFLSRNFSSGLLNTKLHSKADRGGDEESTQAYVLVRRGV